MCVFVTERKRDTYKSVGTVAAQLCNFWPQTTLCLNTFSPYHLSTNVGPSLSLHFTWSSSFSLSSLLPFILWDEVWEMGHSSSSKLLIRGTHNLNAYLDQRWSAHWVNYMICLWDPLCVCVCVCVFSDSVVVMALLRANDFPFKKNAFSVSHLVNSGFFFRFSSFCSPWGILMA